MNATGFQSCMAGLTRLCSSFRSSAPPYLSGLLTKAALIYLGLLLIRCIGLVNKEPYSLDEVSINLGGIKYLVDHNMASLHPHCGLVFIVGGILKIFALAPTYGNSVLVLNALSLLAAPVLYLLFSTTLSSEKLGLCAALLVGMSPPLIFQGFMLYGSAPSTLFVFFATLLLLFSFREFFRRWFFSAIAGLCCGIAYSCHESGFPFTCALWGTFSAAAFVLFVMRRISFWTFLVVPLSFALAFALPLLAINYLVPAAYALMGVDYKELVQNHGLDYDMSGGRRDYFGSLMYVWKCFKSGGNIVIVLKPIPVLTLIYKMLGGAVLLFAAIGTISCILKREFRFMLICIPLLLIWLVGISPTPVVVLRAVSCSMPVIIIFTAIGIFQAVEWLSACAGTSIPNKIGVQCYEHIKNLAAFLIVCCLSASGFFFIWNSSTALPGGLGELMKCKANVSRVLAYDHLFSWHYLKGAIPLGGRTLEKMRENFDYVVVEPMNSDSYSIYMAFMKDRKNELKVVGVVDNPLGSTNYFNAECDGLYFLKEWDANKCDLKRTKLYIFDIRKP